MLFPLTYIVLIRREMKSLIRRVSGVAIFDGPKAASLCCDRSGDMTQRQSRTNNLFGCTPRYASTSSSFTPIPREISLQSVKETLMPYYHNRTPVILEGYAQQWTALEKWKDWEYLLGRTMTNKEEWHCDVEMGSYNSGESLCIPFSSYLDYLMLYREQQEQRQAGGKADSEASPVLYLAQNDLPHGLYDDIQLPSFLKSNTAIIADATNATPSSDILGEGKLYQCMFWMGPPRSMSPLHYDPLDNLLTQVVGTKNVALLNRTTSREKLKVGSAHGQQENTSALPMQSILSGEVAVPDLDFWTGTLKPGDALYVPAKWWHFVESPDDFSISVNVWWR